MVVISTELMLNRQTAEVQPFAMWLECAIAFGRGLYTVWLMSVVSGMGCSLDSPKFVGGNYENSGGTGMLLQ